MDVYSSAKSVLLDKSYILDLLTLIVRPYKKRQLGLGFFASRNNTMYNVTTIQFNTITLPEGSKVKGHPDNLH